MPHRNIVGIGSSFGGVESLTALVRTLPADFPCAVLVAHHVPENLPSALPAVINRVGALPVVHPQHGDQIQSGRIYIAPPNFHLITRRGKIVLDSGPRENGHRPSVDVLFRSLALDYGPRAIGVVLSGYLDDGTAGLMSIRRHGGLAVVQDPADAAASGMPASAIVHVGADYVASASDMGNLLIELAKQEIHEAVMNPHNHESLREETEPKDMEDRGPPSPITCPECGGVLWVVNEQDVMQYRCHVGHAYSPESLVDQQGVSVEKALWSALRALKENAALALRIAQRAQAEGRSDTADAFMQRYREGDENAETIRRLLLGRKD